MKYICFIFCVFFVGACSNKSYKDTLFCELDEEVQDTLLSISQKVFEHDYEAPDMIDFSGYCKLSVKFLSSWVISKQIVDTVNKKSVSLPTNAQCHISCITTLFIIPMNTTCWYLDLRIRRNSEL